MENLLKEIPQNCEPAINIREAAKLLDCSYKTIHHLAVTGKIPYFRVGNRLKFRASALDEWMRNKLQSSSPSVSR